MILQTWDKVRDISFSGLDDTLQRSGIIDAKRILYMFYSTIDIENMNNPDKSLLDDIIIGKAILVNMSVTAVNKCEDGFTNSRVGFLNKNYFYDGTNMVEDLHNTLEINYNTYMFDTKVNNKNIRDIENTVFSLKDSYIYSHINDFNINKRFEVGYNFYSADMRDNDGVRNRLLDNIMISSPNLVDPEYFTQSHMYNVLGDVYDISSLSYLLHYEGHQFIDPNTTVVLCKLNKWDSMVPEIRDKMYDIRFRNTSYNDMVDLTEISQLLLYDTVSKNQLSGAVYIIDSDMGINVCNTTKTMLPFRKYEFDNAIKIGLRDISDTLLHYVNSLARKHGPTRLLYSPLYHGDKIKATFKDYNPDNQPIIKNNQNIDVGMTVTNEVSDIVSTETEDEYYDGNPGYEEDY